jgi:flagellar assembly protein FliH
VHEFVDIPVAEPEPESEPEIIAEPEIEVALKKEIPHQHFTETFVIYDHESPVEINLSNIKEETVPLDVAMTEVQNAYDRGFSDGQKASEAVFVTEIEDYRKWMLRIDKVVDEMRESFADELVKFEKVLLDTATMIAEHILEHEISQNSEIVIEQIKKVIRDVEDENVYEVRLNSEDVFILKEIKSSVFANKEKYPDVKFISDDRIRPGGCIVQTSAGTIDARISRQIERIKIALREIMNDPELKAQM